MKTKFLDALDFLEEVAAGTFSGMIVVGTFIAFCLIVSILLASYCLASGVHLVLAALDR